MAASASQVRLVPDRLLEGTCRNLMTYNSGPWKSICVLRQLLPNIVDNIQCRTKHKECSHGNDIATLFNFTSNQTNPSARLGSAVRESCLEVNKTYHRCNLQQIILVAFESFKDICSARFMMIRSIEKTVLNQCECNTDIRERVGKQESSPEIFDCFLYDSTDKWSLHG